MLENDYFSSEDAEIVGACPTQPDKVLVTGAAIGGLHVLVARRGFSGDLREDLWAFSRLAGFPVGVTYRAETLELPAYCTLPYF